MRELRGVLWGLILGTFGDACHPGSCAGAGLRGLLQQLQPGSEMWFQHVDRMWRLHQLFWRGDDDGRALTDTGAYPRTDDDKGVSDVVHELLGLA